MCVHGSSISISTKAFPFLCAHLRDVGSQQGNRPVVKLSLTSETQQVLHDT